MWDIPCQNLPIPVTYGLTDKAKRAVLYAQHFRTMFTYVYSIWIMGHTPNQRRV